MDPVAFDPNTAPKNLGQDWDLEQRTTVALDHAERAIAAGWRRVTEDPPREVRVFDMEPDDVVLIGGVDGAWESVLEMQEWARSEWPNRRVVFFAADIDVRLLREFDGEDAAAVLRGGEQAPGAQPITPSGDVTNAAATPSLVVTDTGLSLYRARSATPGEPLPEVDPSSYPADAVPLDAPPGLRGGEQP